MKLVEILKCHRNSYGAGPGATRPRDWFHGVAKIGRNGLLQLVAAQCDLRARILALGAYARGPLRCCASTPPWCSARSTMTASSCSMSSPPRSVAPAADFGAMTSDSKLRTNYGPTAIPDGRSRSNVEIPSPEQITGVILAGGLARRMGGQDKGLVAFGGRPLVEWVIDGLRPQVRVLVINANRNRGRYADYGYPVIADVMGDFQGPLAGFSSALAAVQTPWIVTVPCDGPSLAPDLVARLCAALREQQAELAVASDGRRMQPVYALIARALAPSLEAFLATGERKIDRWYARHRTATADFSDRPGCFANINSNEDIERLGQGQLAQGRFGQG